MRSPPSCGRGYSIMNTRLLRMAETGRLKTGVRRWTIPGQSHPVTLIPKSLSYPGWGPALHWPMVLPNGEVIRRGLDLDRHLSIAKREIRALLNQTGE